MINLFTRVLLEKYLCRGTAGRLLEYLLYT
jgi:hypothetical protein